MSVTAQHNSVDASVAHPGTVEPRADFGDVRAEFQALVSSSGVYERSVRAKIALTGSDRVRWLNGMVTNNIRDLEPGGRIWSAGAQTVAVCRNHMAANHRDSRPWRQSAGEVFRVMAGSRRY